MNLDEYYLYKPQCIIGVNMYIDSKYRATLAQKVREDENRSFLKFLHSGQNPNSCAWPQKFFPTHYRLPKPQRMLSVHRGTKLGLNIKKTKRKSLNGNQVIHF